MDADAETAIARYRLAPARTAFAGPAGGRLGRGFGSALDFAEFRDYALGDDLRRVDWRAYARTDQLKVRLDREEVAPSLDVCVDLSASMASTPAKERAARALVRAFLAWGDDAGARGRAVALGGDALARGDAPAFTSPTTTLEPPRVPLRRRGLRAVVSDFLTPTDPAPLLRRLAVGAAELAVIQLLDPWEDAPDAEGATTLVDVETGRRRDVRLGPAAVRAYGERLARLKAAVADGARSVGARYACVLAGPADAMFGGPLLRAGITEPR